ncbi:DUF2723 domain-containing protein [Fibrobacterota bacterium]
MPRMSSFNTVRSVISLSSNWPYRIIICAIVTAGYLLTVARTVSLWDCGEFIACIHTLGIAHPPGSPLFMMLGKSWELMLFFIPHIAFRINLLSVFLSVAACLLLFEVVCGFAERLKMNPSLIRPCGLMAGLLLAFSDTFWFNGVEAEVYAFSIVEMLLGLLIVLKWDRSGRSPYSPWILLLIYVSFLGIGVHMYSMLLVPFLLFFVGLRSGRIAPGLNFYLLAGTVTAAFIACFIYPELVENSTFLLAVTGLALWFLVRSISKHEVSDVSYWTLGLLLCTVITLTKPFLVTVVLMLAVLSILLLALDGKSPWSWIYGIVSSGLVWALVRFVPLKGQFAFSLGNSDIWMCLVLGTVILASCIFSLTKKPGEGKQKLHFYAKLLILAIVGYSTFMYIPIRSHLNPVIDENDPENWGRLQAFIERKQYGSESMLVRMFNRRGLWSSQFGYGYHMGYFKYHSSQFYPAPEKDGKRQAWSAFNWHRFLAAAMLLLTIWILAENFRRHRAWVGLMLFLFAVCSAGLVLYMNFADGNRIEVRELKQWKKAVKQVRSKLLSKGIPVPKIPDPNAVNDLNRALQFDSSAMSADRRGAHVRRWEELKTLAGRHHLRLPGIPEPVHAEVRERDYFFTPAFVLFIALFAAAVFLVLDGLSRKYPRLAFLWRTAGWGLALFLWCVPFVTHYKSHTRAFDYVASDFARNILTSCPPNAILFTNGDNDTFPLWYMQQVEKVRTDVTVVNFSLANTDWYARQFTYQEPRVKLPSFGKGEELPQARYIRFKNVQRIPLPGDTSIAFELGGKGVGMYVRLQDRVLLEAAMFNYPRRSLCFTLSTPARATLGLEKHFQTVGLVHVVSPHSGLNLEVLDDNLLENYRYRYLGDRRLRLSATAERIVRNYRELIRMGKNSHVFNINRLSREPKSQEAIAKEKELLDRYTRLEEKLFPSL